MGWDLLEASESSGKLPLRTSIDGESVVSSPVELASLVFSSDIDPDLNTVIRWHLANCTVCDPDQPPPPFGMPATKYCDEYWEIIQEYADYEVKYAWKGNP